MNFPSVLHRWLIESKLHQLSFSRQKLGYCYFFAAATLFSPELADARLSWAKNGVLTTVVDDFFDVGSSEEEQLKLIQLVDKYASLLPPSPFFQKKDNRKTKSPFSSVNVLEFTGGMGT